MIQKALPILLVGVLGSFAAADIRVDDSPSGAGGGVIMARGNGEWIVMYIDYGPLGKGIGRFDEWGNRTYGPAQAQWGSEWPMRITTAWSGSRIGWFYDTLDLATGEYSLWFHTIDADGNLLSSPVHVNPANTSGGLALSPDLLWSDGEFLASYLSQDFMGQGRGIALRRIAGDGSLASPEMEVYTVGLGEIIWPEVGRVDSALHAQWRYLDDQGELSLWGIWADPQGSILVPAMVYKPAVTNVSLFLRDVLSREDRVAVFYNPRQNSNMEPTEQLHIDPTGTILLGPQQIGDPQPGGGHQLAGAPGGVGIVFIRGGQTWLRRVASDGFLASDSIQVSDVPGAGVLSVRGAFSDRTYGVVWGDRRYEPTWGNVFLNFAPGYELFVTGAGPSPSAAPQVDLFQPENTAGGPVVSFAPYAAGGYGANVGAGDVNGDEADEVLTGPGPGDIYGPQVRAFDWRGNPIPKVNFYAYGTLKYGVKAEGGKLDTDLPHEILTAPGPGAVFGPHIRAWNFDNTQLQPIQKVNFYAYNTLRYGANVAGVDVDGDGYAEILTGPGPGVVFGSQLRGFNFDGGSVSAMSKINTFVYAGSSYGLHVAGGDTTWSDRDQIACGAGPGPVNDSTIAVYQFFGISGLAELPGSRFEAFSGTFGGAQVSFCQHWDRDINKELLVSQGPVPSSSSEVRVFDDSAAGFGQLISFEPYPAQTHGSTLTSVFVGF